MTHINPLTHVINIILNLLFNILKLHNDIYHSGSIKVTPHYQAATIGDTVIFKCQSDTKVAWKFDKGQLPSNARVHRRDRIRSVLKIQNVQTDNMGMYTCYLVDDVQIPNDDLKDSLNFEDKGLLMVESKL